MHKVDISYRDYFNDDKPAVETMYFNINAWELAEIAAEFDDDLAEYMRKAFGEGGNYKDGFKVLKLLFIKGYGRRKEASDGSGRIRFVKDPAWIAELLPSPEFEAFYLKLTDDEKFATDFWNGLVSAELLERANKIRNSDEVKPTATGTDEKYRDLPLEEQLALIQAKIAAKKPANEG